MTRTALAAAAIVSLGLSATTALASPYDWTSGTFVPGTTAPNPLPAGELLRIIGTSNKTFSGGVFDNLGTVEWSGGGLFLGSGAQVNNAGLWDIAGDLTLAHGGGATTGFANTGVLRRSAGDGVAVFGNSPALAFVNSGQIDVLSGTLRFAGANSFLAGTQFTGSGVAEVTSNSSFAGGFQSQNLRLASGTWTGQAAVANGQVEWTAGTFGGDWTLAEGAVLTATGASSRTIGGADTVLTNDGRIDWTGTGGLFLGNGATVVNRGEIDFQTNAGISYGGGAVATIVNEGVLRRSAADGVTIAGNSSAIDFVNRGTLQADGGVLRLSSASRFEAGTVFAGAGVVEVTSDSTFAGAFQSQSLRLANGTWTGDAAVANGQIEWTAGTFAGQWALAEGAVVTATGASNRFIGGAGTVLTNDGRLDWTATGGLFLSNGATVVNRGEIDFQTNAGITYGGGAVVTLVNEGVLRRSAADGVTTAGNSTAINFVNRGTLQADGGVLRLSSDNRFENGTVFAGAGVVEVTSASTFAGSFQSENLRLAGGTWTGEAAVAGGQVEWSAGTFEGDWTLAEGAEVTASGAGNRFISGADTVVTNDGRIAWTGTGGLFMSSGASLVNRGEIDLQDGGNVSYGGGAAVSLLNEGLLVVSNGNSAAVATSTSFDFVNTGTVDVRAGSTLTLGAGFGNDGTMTGDGVFAVAGAGLNNRGTVAPGSFGAGTLGLTGAYTQDGVGIFAVDLTDLSSFDFFSISGTASLAGTLALNCLGDCSFEVGDSMTILQSGGVLAGSFATVTLSGFATGAFDVVYDVDSRSVQLFVTETVTAIPEPGTWALWLAGLGTLGWVARRRTRRD